MRSSGRIIGLDDTLMFNDEVQKNLTKKIDSRQIYYISSFSSDAKGHKVVEIKPVLAIDAEPIPLSLNEICAYGTHLSWQIS